MQRYIIVFIALFSLVKTASADTSILVQGQRAYYDGIRSGQYKTPEARADLAARTIGAAQMQYDRAMNAQWKSAIESASQSSTYNKDVLEPSLWDSLSSMFHLDKKKTASAEASPAAESSVVVPNAPASPPDVAVDGNGIPRLIEFGKRSPASTK